MKEVLFFVFSFLKTFKPGMFDTNLSWSENKIENLKCMRSKGRRVGVGGGWEERGRIRNINREKKENGASWNYFYKKGS